MVIFDDPMNSNDETTQYLMYSYIQNFYKGDNSFKDANKQVFVLLTHNAHFFLNARPYRWQPGDKKVSCFTLTKENSTTAIQKSPPAQMTLKQAMKHYGMNFISHITMIALCPC